MRIFMTAGFVRFSRKERLSNKSLHQLASEVEQGLTGSTLGASVYKKRFARQGSGKRAGFRVIHAYRGGKKIFLIEGYAKSESLNLTRQELKAVRSAAAIMLNWTEDELEKLLNEEILKEV